MILISEHKEDDDAVQETEKAKEDTELVAPEQETKESENETPDKEEPGQDESNLTETINGQGTTAEPIEDSVNETIQISEDGEQQNYDS